MTRHGFIVLLCLTSLGHAQADPAASKGIIAPPAMFRVGAFGPPCTHATLAAAINAASGSGTTVIRLANNQVYNSINENILGKNITIEGGFVDCTAATPQANTRTTLTGAQGSNDSVIEIIGGANERTIVLRDLEIEGGEPDGDGGGGVEIDGSAVVTFDNLLIARSRSNRGGGVHVSGATHPVELRFVGGAELLNLDSAALLDNEATIDGGGLYCEQAAIRVDGVLRSWLNDAAGRGGGLYLDDCSLTVGDPGVDAARLLVAANEAHSGGGLWAQGGSLVLLRGLRHEFELNEAGESGGGIALTDALTAMYADRTSVYGNLAHNQNIPMVNTIEHALGGGVYVGNGALADFDDGPPTPCTMPFVVSGGPNEPFCVRFRGNEARADAPQGLGMGGAIYVDNAELRVRQARLVANASDVGTAVHAAGDATEVLLESVIVDHNSPGVYALSFGAGADATVAFATFNDASDGAYSMQVRGAGTTLGFHASVIADLNHPGVEIDSEAKVQVSCLIASLAATVPVIAVPSSGDFVALYSDDYQPSPTSQLIDRCHDTPYAPTSRDVRGVARPVDDLARANDPGVYDVGAFERQPDHVFADSFEGAL